MSGKQNRGLNIITSSEVMSYAVKDKFGKTHNVPIEQRYTTLSLYQRFLMFQKCAPVFSVIAGRALRISTLDYTVTPIRLVEDEIAAQLKMEREIYFENKGQSGLRHIGRMMKSLQVIKRHLPDVFKDLSNFDASLVRWKKRIKITNRASAGQIEDFFSNPSPGVLWSDFSKMLTLDLLIHGAYSLYNRNNNYFLLPGGTVYPIKPKYVGGIAGYVQIPIGVEQPQLFMRDEVVYRQYLPSSNLANGIKPLEALIDLVTENLLFSDMMVDKADGNEPPQKVVIFAEPEQLEGQEPSVDVRSEPLNKPEQIRAEKQLNEKRKEAAIKVLSGYGRSATVLDLSKAETLATQLARQDKIDKYVAMVYNASNQEINQTGSDGTSGRSVSETQERSDNAKGIRPFVTLMEESFGADLIPPMFGYGWQWKFSSPVSESERIDNAIKKMPLFGVNQIREDDFNAEAYPEDIYNRPQQQQAPSPATADDIAGLLRG